jgi:hypothetical protein
MRGWDRSPTAIGGTRICKRKVHTSSADMVNRFRGVERGSVFFQSIWGRGKWKEEGENQKNHRLKSIVGGDACGGVACWTLIGRGPCWV